jgi:serralysin
MTSPYVSGDTSTYGLSGDTRINPLLVWGHKWGNTSVGTPVSLTYSFPQPGADWLGNYYDQEPFNGFSPFTAEQQQAARDSLALWSHVANITFTEISENTDPGTEDVGDLRFGNSAAVTNSRSAAWGYLPYEDGSNMWPENGDVWFDVQYDPNLEFNPGQFGLSTMIHEIGHAIGLDHPFADEPGELASPAAQSNQRYTIMAYNRYSGASPGFEAYGPMLYDIAAIQYLYGANKSWHNGDDVYTFQTDKEYLECIWDAGGHDTIDLSLQSRNQVIDLREGHFSSIGVKNNGLTGNGNVAIAFKVEIEDAIGGNGHDKITGNAVANSLNGGIGNDTIVGGAGDDTLDGSVGTDSMNGEAGNDLYKVNVATDRVIELLTQAKGGGIDTIESDVTYSLALLANVENLTLLGGLNATGNALANTLIGNGNANLLDGKTGADLLMGGAGNDTYILDNAGDVVDEQGNADASDTVKSSATIAAAITGIENYLYTGVKAWTFTADAGNNVISSGSAADTLKGGDGNDSIVGGAGNDSLFGEGGNDTLDGGLGSDALAGGAGNDLYVINVATDSITEEGADADDHVRSTVTVNLALLASGLIEHATLLGAGAINAFGNDSINHLTGNTGANKLDGGIGADVLTGDKGSDIYVVDDAGDVVNETIGGTAGGIDTVQSSIDFDLTALVNVEKLVLAAGFVGLDGIGNGLNNTLTGNEFANTLSGGAGRDTMAGGAGDDHYFVDNIYDVVTESVLNAKGGGIDTVESSVTYSLAARANVDHLILTGGNAINGTGNALNNELTGNANVNKLDGGTGNDSLVGNDGNDTLIGGAGNDLLDGGVGTDRMTGGLGNDVFDFNLLGELGDVITDFKKGADLLDISDLLVGYNDVFDQFVSFTKVGTSTEVYVDSDGLGGGTSALLATLLNVQLTSADSASFIVETV